MTSGKPQDSLADAMTTALGMGWKVGEMAVASSLVVGTRLMMMGAAMRDPTKSDYRELGRMMPEKMFAFAQSGVALMEQLSAAQADATAQMVDAGNLMSGGIPTASSMMTLATEAGRRGTQAMLWPLTAGEATMAPMHRTVTANARRLGRGGKRRG